MQKVSETGDDSIFANSRALSKLVGSAQRLGRFSTARVFDPWMLGDVLKHLTVCRPIQNGRRAYITFGNYFILFALFQQLVSRHIMHLLSRIIF